MAQDSVPAAAPPRSLLQRIIGVVTSPGETMASVAAHPTFWDVLLLSTVISAIAVGVFMSTEVGQSAFVDQQVASRESMGMSVPPEQYAGLQRLAAQMWIIQPVTVLFFGPLMTALVAGILYGVFVVMGGEARYRQVFAVVTHAGIITLLQAAFTLPVNYQRQSLSSATNLSVFFPDLSEGSFLASVLGFIDLFWIWYLIVLAIGLAAVYRRKWTSIAGGLFIVYVLIGLGIAAVKAALGGR